MVNSPNGSNLGFEQNLWQAADKLRKNMDAAEYKHVVLGLIFLKFITDSKYFERDKKNKNLNDFVKTNGNISWNDIITSTRSEDIGKQINQLMKSIEQDNPYLKDALPKEYDKHSISSEKLWELIDLINSIDINVEINKSDDILGRVYEYFLGEFAKSEGSRGGQFYTPRCVVKLLVEMISPYKGNVYDPCCGSGGMFVQSDKFVEIQGGNKSNVRVFGQESNFTTWKLCKLNLWLRKIPAEIKWGDSFIDDGNKNLKADYILSNPPFNDSDWGGNKLKDDDRWKYGNPPVGNANYAWIQHYIHHLSEKGIAGFVLTNGSLSSNNLAEYEIRRKIIKSDLVDCIVYLPDKLFYNTQISTCLWFLTKNKKNKYCDRSGKILFIDASDFGSLTSKRHRELTNAEIRKVCETYHKWKNLKYKDIQGYCKSVTLSEVKEHNYSLVPGRYVGCKPLILKGISKSDIIKVQQILKERLELLKKIENNSFDSMGGLK